MDTCLSIKTFGQFSLHVNWLRRYIAMTCRCSEFWQRSQIRLLSLIVLLFLVKSCMRNAKEEFLSDSEMREIENVMSARYSLNTNICKNYSQVRILSKPNGRFLNRLRFAMILLLKELCWKVSGLNFFRYDKKHKIMYCENFKVNTRQTW